MNVSDLNEKIEDSLKITETPEKPPSTSEPSSIDAKVTTRIPRPTGIKAPSGIPRIFSNSVQRPISVITSPTTNSPQSAPPPSSQATIQLQSTTDDSSYNDKTDKSNDSMKENINHEGQNAMANRSMSFAATTDISSPTSGIRSRNTQSITRTENSNRNQYMNMNSNNSQCAETESQGSSGSRRSSSSYSYISLGDPRMIHAKINSLANIEHVPGGGNIKIFNQKIDTSKAQAKCGSVSNIKYKPGGGNVKIINEKVEFKAESKTKSLKNVKHVPGGGNRVIHNETLPWLKYNAPNLSKEEKIKIAKHKVG